MGKRASKNTRVAGTVKLASGIYQVDLSGAKRSLIGISWQAVYTFFSAALVIVVTDLIKS